MNLEAAFQIYAQIHGQLRQGCIVHEDCRNNHELARACAPRAAPSRVVGLRRTPWPMGWMVRPIVFDPAWARAGTSLVRRNDVFFQDGQPMRYEPTLEDMFLGDWEFVVEFV